MNLNVDKIIKIFFNKYFAHQHPDAALRYLPVVKQIKKNNLINSKILEIGSGSLGITPYLKKEILGIDIDFSGPQSNLLTQIKGTYIKLPYKKNSIDVVISVDVLEHLPKNERQKAIYEQIKVTKKLALIVVPIGKKSELQDQMLNYRWQKVFKNQSNYQFLDEHLKNGLPSTDEILVYIDKSARALNKKYKLKSNKLLNLKVRELLLRTWISRNKLLYYLYMKGFLILLPILLLCNFGNCYRRIFVIEFLNSKTKS